MTEPTLTRNQVIEGYRMFFGRVPETEAVVTHAMNAFSGEHQFWRGLVSSEEFLALRAKAHQHEHDPDMMKAIAEAYWAPRRDIEYDVPDETMALLVKRIQGQWTKLGQDEPHWSVLTDERFLSTKLTDQALEHFNETGREAASLVAHFERRTGKNAPSGLCLELGCGVGRITRHLATRFDRVIAVDISPGNLALCEQYMIKAGIDNVETRQIATMADFETLPEFDFFYSIITLQHNSPPIQKAMLEMILSKVRPGGAVLFQIPTDMLGYQFGVHGYLESEEGVMEVHALPRTVIFDLLRRHGLEIQEIAPDGFIGAYGSETFYATKPPVVETGIVH